MPLSLAPWKYRSVSQGPISRLSYRTSQLVDGRPVFDAFAYLSHAPKRDDMHIYGSADGNGTHATKQGAVHRAISEAMERWAFYENCHSPARSRYGFDIDPTTTGMAAFPGLNPRSARAAAWRETVERWSVAEWWRGHLSHEVFAIPNHPHLHALEIESRWTDTRSVIVWSDVPGSLSTAYGFAAGPTRALAVDKALTELTRNVRVLGLYFANSPERNSPPTCTERRLLYFAGTEGAKDFQNRVARTVPHLQTPTPRLIIDTPIEGRWSRYAHVWRCLFEGGDESGDDDETFFLF